MRKHLLAIAASTILTAMPAQAAEVFNENVSGDVDAAKLDSSGNLTPFVLPVGTSTFTGGINSGSGDPIDSYLFQVLNGQSYTSLAITVSGVQIASGAFINLFTGAGAPIISGQAFGNYSTALNLAPGFYTLTLGDGVVVGNYSVAVTAVGPNVTAAVPEPSTWLMMLLGFGTMGFTMRRRRRVTANVHYA